MPEGSDAPVRDVIAGMTAVSLDLCDLPAGDHLLARIAALAAIGAPPLSYLLHVGPAAEVGVTVEQVQGVLVAIAPIIGTARTAVAAANIAEALGVAIAVAAAELEAELEAEAE
jgi:alkylhydroperoxidase/carboxymuconolactone decarboxylase family protein YurZ